MPKKIKSFEISRLQRDLFLNSIKQNNINLNQAASLAKIPTKIANLIYDCH